MFMNLFVKNALNEKYSTEIQQEEISYSWTLGPGKEQILSAKSRIGFECPKRALTFKLTRDFNIATV